MKSYARLAELPNSEGKMTLKVQIDDFERARDAVAKLQRDMTEQAADLPPTHTPISVLFDESEDDTQELND